MKILIARNTGEVVDSYEDVELADIDSKVFNPSILEWMKKTFRNASATESNMTKFESTARKLASQFGQRVGALEWSIFGDKIVTGHYISGNSFGTIDLKDGRIQIADRFAKLDPSCDMYKKSVSALRSIVAHIEAVSEKM